MKYTLTMLQEQFDELTECFKNNDGKESAAYLFCNISSTRLEKRLIVHKVQLVKDEDVKSKSPNHISIKSQSYVKAIASADKQGFSLAIVHTHPMGYDKFSIQDDKNEHDFFRTAYIRAPKGLHASLIFIGNPVSAIVGRIWLNENKYVPLNRIRVIGRRFHIFDFDSKNIKIIAPKWSDRQVRAFSEEVQIWLRTLNVGIVGAGGTGSSVCEQLIRLGVGKLTVVDGQTLEDTNVTRLYGSRLSDKGKAKVVLIKRLAREIGLGTRVTSIEDFIFKKEVAQKLKDCDLVFCCTDDATGRSILNRLAIYYFIPVIDMAISIDSENKVIKEITGRVTTLLPNTACLICRGRITQDQLTAEVLNRLHPEEYKTQVARRYIHELPERDPAIIMFTTNIASKAVAEFLQMLTGYMGGDWRATELIEKYHESDLNIRLGKNSRQGQVGCMCTDKTKWGHADQLNFLGRKW